MSDWSMQTLTPIRCNHRRHTMCTSSRSIGARRFPAELRQTTAKNAKLPIAGPVSTGAGGGWTKPTVLNIKPFKKEPFEPKSCDSSRDDSSPNSGTFLKFWTLKILPCSEARFSNFKQKILLCPPRISSLYKFIGMLTRLSTSFL